MVISPLIPYVHVMILQILYVRTALQKPEQLVDDEVERNFLRGHEWKSSSKVKAHLMTKEAVGPRASTVVFVDTVIAHETHEIQVLFHSSFIRVLFKSN